MTTSLAFTAEPYPETERIRIIADRLTSNSQESYAEFQGNVEATQGDFQITSDQLRIYYKEDRSSDPTSGEQDAIQKVVATGNVKIKAEDKRATTDKVEYTPETGILVMSGPNTTLISERNSISGSRVTMQRESRQIRVDGSERERVKAIFYTEKGKTEGLLSLPEKPSGDPEKTEQAPEQKPDVEIVETEPEVAVEADRTTTDKTVQESEKDTPAMAYVDVDSGEQKTIGKTDEPVEPPEPEDSQIETPAKQEVEKDATDIAMVEPAATPETISADAPQPVVEQEPAIKPDETVPDEETLREQYATIAPDTLLKKVAIAALDNQTFYKGPEIQTLFYQGLVDQITSDTKDAIISTPASPQFPTFLRALPRHPSGQVDNFALAALGRPLGLNYIVTGAVTEIAIDRGVSGVLWLKEAHFVVHVSVSIDVFDVETGTKLLTDNYTYTINLDDTTYDISQVEKEMPPELVEEAFTNLVPQIGEAITEALNDREWKGFVTAISTEDVTISAGNQVGLQVGNVFSVYDVKIIAGADGHNFIVPGMKTGEVILTEVSPDQSRATLISGDGIREGSSIKKIEK